MSDSQKFIARNRAPRVQIEYDVELYGASKKVQLPFVMGVMSDLSGTSEQPPVSERGFLEIDVDTFDDRMNAMAPKATFSVPNTLTGEGNLAIDLTFRKMRDFSPQAIAENVDALRPLLEARTQLTDLMAYMDGKSGAEMLIENLLTQPALLQALSGEHADSADTQAALDSLRANLPEDIEDTKDTVSDTLASLAAQSPTEVAEDTSVSDALSTLTPPPEVAKKDTTNTVLDGIARVEDTPEVDNTNDVLASVERREDVAARDKTDEILSGIEPASSLVSDEDTTADVLAGIEAVEETPQADTTSDVLATLEAPTETEPQDHTADVLASIDYVEVTVQEDKTDEILNGVEAVQEAPEADLTNDVLAALEAPPAPVAQDDTADVLAGIEAIAQVEEDDKTEHVLASLEPVAQMDEPDLTDDVLAALEPVIKDAAPTHSTADILSTIELSEDTPEPTDQADDILANLDDINVDEPAEDTTGAILANLEAPEPVTQTKETVVADVLSGIESPPEGKPLDEMADDVLAAIEPVVTDALDETTADDVLAALDTVTDIQDAGDVAAEVLSSIHRTTDIPQRDETTDILTGIENTTQPPEADTADDVLTEIAQLDIGPADVDQTQDILAGIETGAQDAPIEDTADDILAALDAPVADDTDDTALDDILGSLDTAPETAEQDEATDDILAGLDSPDPAKDTDDVMDDVLASLEPAPEEVEDDSALDAALASIDTNPVLNNEADEADALDDILNSLEPTAPEVPQQDTVADVLESLEPIEPQASDDAVDLDDMLAGMETTDADGAEANDTLNDILAGFDEAPVEQSAEDSLDDILGSLEADTPDTDDVATAEHSAQTDASDLDGMQPVTIKPDTEPAQMDGADTNDDDLDALLAGLDTPSPEEATAIPDEDNDLDALLAGLDSLADTVTTEPEADDLDALMADFDEPDQTPPEAGKDAADDDLDSLLNDLMPDQETAEDPEPTETEDDDLDALLADLDVTEPDLDPKADPAVDDLDALLSGLDDDMPNDTSDLSAADAGDAAPAQPAQSPFGVITAPRPAREDLNRRKFRMAILGDFTGRAARGMIETGAALASRKPILLDVDTVEDVIEGFATTLTLPIGKDGTGLEVKLTSLDDLHPDELYDNVEVFDALNGLRQQLGIGSMAEKARERLQRWSETYARPIRLPKHSAGTSVPANKTLSDFQALIGDTAGTLTQASPADDIIARVVGPHIVAAPDAGSEAMLGAVDDALSSAMRLVLHHPEFQAVEAQWRSLDLLARRIETDSSLEIVLYDISAEELAADLASQEELSQSGLFSLLTDVLDPEEGAGGFSALFGMYTFEETPPHAEILARIGTVAAHVDAPFFAAMTPGYLDTAKEDRHPLTARAWDSLRDLPEASYLGLASPRFLLRQPYGAKSDPIYPFKFEEFTPREGLSGMLWANPVVLVAILLAGTYKKDGKAMNLGSMMSLGDMPFHYVNDRYGDQVALPCTERNLTSDPAQATLARGLMPVVWIKGRNEIRLGSFRSLGGDEISGPWSGSVPAARAPDAAPTADITMDLPVDGADDSALDDLLAGFEDDTDAIADTDDMDPELAALLEGL